MAISYIVGIPRSGKSYLAVYKLWKNFIFKPKKTLFSKFVKPKDIKINYEIAYTNINEFNFDKSDKIEPLNYEKIYNNLSLLHEMYINGDDDNKLIKKARQLNLYKALFVFDECHNYLKSKDDKVLVWWLTYHGHLFQDIWLITQDLALVNNEYKRVAEFFYKAVPPASRLFVSKFRYIQYSSYKMYQKDVIQGGGYTLPALKDVFAMYQSGAKNNAKSVVKKYLYIAIIPLFLLIPFSVFFMSLFTDHKKIDNEKNILNSATNKPIIAKEITPLEKYENDLRSTNKLYDIKCFKKICNYKGFEFPKALLLELIVKENFTFIWNDSSFKQDRFFILVQSDNKSFDFLKGVDNAIKNKNKKNSSKSLPIIN